MEPRAPTFLAGARALWHSIQQILALPENTRLFTGHDYCPDGREKPLWKAPLRSSAPNIHLTKAKTEEDFVLLRQNRDHEFPMPKLILHSLQVNVRGGRLPEQGKGYLKIPIDALKNAPWEE